MNQVICKLVLAFFHLLKTSMIKDYFKTKLLKRSNSVSRSYELMEKILKVYVYPDGSKPIFHTPELQGIYASEGWFMKLMEESRRFAVKEPDKAHLFYLPYSSRRLRDVLYKPGSHNIKPLAIFLRDYVNSISSKYPFWNRTRGSDHFLVACHDWVCFLLCLLVLV